MLWGLICCNLYSLYISMALIISLNNNLSYHNNPTSWDSSSRAPASCTVSLHLSWEQKTWPAPTKPAQEHPHTLMQAWELHIRVFKVPQTPQTHRACWTTAFSALTETIGSLSGLCFSQDDYRGHKPALTPTADVLDLCLNPEPQETGGKRCRSRLEKEASLWGVWASAAGYCPGCLLPAGGCGGFHGWYPDWRVLGQTWTLWMNHRLSINGVCVNKVYGMASFFLIYIHITVFVFCSPQ